MLLSYNYSSCCYCDFENLSKYSLYIYSTFLRAFNSNFKSIAEKILLTLCFYGDQK